MESLFVESCRKIELAYDRLGHQIGWRFLNSPASTFSASTQIALITLNPGGSENYPDHLTDSCESGSAYVVEAWGSNNAGEAPLQLQIRRLFDMLAGRRSPRVSGDELLGESLAAYFIPFRSPTLKALGRARESRAFAHELWQGLFERLDPRLIITIDRITTKALTDILQKKLDAIPVVEEYPVGWGNYTADLISFESASDPLVLLRLPHLSRFRVFGRAASQRQLERLMDQVARLAF